jgi:deoxyribose-phosphate aldolase
MNMASSSILTGSAAAIDTKDWKSVASIIDHTLLRPETSRDQVIQLCEEALGFGFCTVFVHPSYTASAASILRGSHVKVGTPIGFPLGACLTSTKRFETEEALKAGAQEIDMVINNGALKSGDRNRVQLDIHGVAEIAHDGGAVLKVIIEAGLLTVEEKILACELSLLGGADFVKTSTGWFGGGAAADDVALMRGVVGDRAGVKAAGGIRTASDVANMVAAGANRIGTSAAVQIIHELRG